MNDDRISKFAPSLIKLVEVNLNRLVKSKIDPTSVGIVIVDKKNADEGSDTTGTFGQILPLLMGVLKSDQGDVLHALQEHSAAAIDAGVDVLFPSRTLRVALLAELLRHQLKAPSPAPLLVGNCWTASCGASHLLRRAR